MAAHASSTTRIAVRSRPAPRINYDVRSACLATSASIVGLLALLAVLWMI